MNTAYNVSPERYSRFNEYEPLNPGEKINGNRCFSGDTVSLVAATKVELENLISEYMDYFGVTLGEVFDYGFEQGSDRFQTVIRLR